MNVIVITGGRMGFEVFTGKARGRGAHRKLSDSDVRKIRRLHTEGISQRGIAKMFRVCPPYISKIVRGLKRLGRIPKCRIPRARKEV